MPSVPTGILQSKKWSFRSVVSLLFLITGLAVTAAAANRQKLFLWWSEATGIQADLIISTRIRFSAVGRPWAHLAQGGEDLSRNLLSEAARQILNLQAQTIRIDHIYDGYQVVSRDSSGQLIFDWRRLDEVVNSIRQSGAVPLLSLSYMPPAISRGDIVDRPQDWSEWALVVEKTIQHYSGELGIPDVAYEVWNEPDWFGKWGLSGDKNYLELYRFAALGAGRVGPVRPFKLGGPAVTHPSRRWLDSLLSLAESGVRLDFISWHRYSHSFDQYAKDMELIASLKADHSPIASKIEWYVTEVGPDSEVNSAFDDSRGAAHLVAVTRAMWDQVQRIYTFEIIDGRDPEGKAFWGRWGILTHPDAGLEVKPRYRAFQFLNQLIGNRLQVSGEGTWVKAMAAAAPGGIIKVMVVNYDRYGRHSETAPLTFTGLTPGRYLAVRTLFGGGSRTQPVSAGADGGLRLLLELPPQTIMLVELSPAPPPIP